MPISDIVKRRLGTNPRRRFLCGIRANISRRSRLQKSRCSSNTRLVEAAGIEPASENPSPQLSTSVAFLLTFPLQSAEKQALRFSSL